MSEHTVDRRLLGRMLREEMLPEEWEEFSAQDWGLVTRQAQEEGVAPLLQWSLSRSGRIRLLPRVDQDFLRAAYVTTRMSNEQNIQELQNITRLFDRAGIPLVVLKGICYAMTIYPEIGLRPMVDLDLLVPDSQLPAALHIVRSWGYVDAMPEATPGLNELLSNAACLKKTQLPFTLLELHHSLVATEGAFLHAVPMDWFWSQTEPLAGYTPGRRLGHLRILSPTAQLLYACAHAMLQHGGRNTRLRWLYDLDLLIRVHAGRIDWDLLLAQAGSFEWGSAVLAALSEVQSYFETPVPEGVLAELKRNSDRNAGRVAEMHLLPATHTLEEYQKLKSLNGWGRLKLLVALVAPGSAYMKQRYDLRHSWTLPFWYLYRWWGILVDAAKTLLHLIQKAITQADHPADGEPS